jgi:hypothetical protein
VPIGLQHILHRQQGLIGAPSLPTCKTIWLVHLSAVLCRRFFASSHFLEDSNTLKKGSAKARDMNGNFIESAITDHFNPEALTV